MNELLKRATSWYKKRKKEAYLNQYWSGSKKFAFVGAGAHSIAHLYPCIQQLGIPLKTIVSATGISAQKMSARFKDCSSTNDLNIILEDEFIAGVFVCTNPTAHFNIAKALLTHNKFVFIEKPPCYSLHELKELIALQKTSVCVPALQKRNCSINNILKKIIKDPLSYSCEYKIGPYPEGDPVFDLFIHPIDNILQLFGNATVKNISTKKDAGEISCSISLLHHNGVMGTVQLSTHYSWSNPRDVIEIVTASEIITAEYPNQLRSYEKPSSVFGVPLDKVLKNKVTTNTYFNNTGIVPSGENNSLFVQGFYGEIEAFAQLVENNQQLIGLESLVDTYAILETIKSDI